MELFESPDLSPLEFCFQGCMNREICRRNVDTRDEYLARNFGCYCPHKTCEDQIRRKTRDLRRRVAKFIEVDGRFSERLVRTVTNMLFLCNNIDRLNSN